MSADNPRRKRTMRGSVNARDELIRSVKSLLGVAADDVSDEWDDARLLHLFHEPIPGNMHGVVRDAPLAGRFAEKLVDRLLFEDDVLLDYIGEEPDDDAPWNDDGPERGDGDGDCACEECEDSEEDGALLVAPPTRAEIDAALLREKLEHAATFVADDEVVRRNDTKRVKTRGRIAGRDVADATRMLVIWSTTADGTGTWHYAETLEKAS